MKKVFLTIVACAFSFVGAYAQNSDVERANQLTKAEQFKTKNSFVKETTIYEDKNSGVRLFAKLFTDLKSGEQLAALEFWPTLGKALTTGNLAPLGYLDMDKVDDLLLALETILTEANNADKRVVFTITYTAPGGIDVIYDSHFLASAVSFAAAAPTVIFRKKWFKVDEYGAQTAVYSEGTTNCSIKDLPKLINSIKEAQTIANQSLEKK